MVKQGAVLISKLELPQEFAQGRNPSISTRTAYFRLRNGDYKSDLACHPGHRKANNCFLMSERSPNQQAPGRPE